MRPRRAAVCPDSELEGLTTISLPRPSSFRPARYGGNLNAFDSKVNTNVPQGTSGVMPESNPDFSTGPSSSQCVAVVGSIAAFIHSC